MFGKFFAHGFCVKYRMLGKILLQGRTQDGLYVLGAHNTKPSIGSHWFTAAREQFPLWHRQLGHPTLPVLRQALGNVLLSKSQIKASDLVWEA